MSTSTSSKAGTLPIVGLYGVSGVGKSYLLTHLQQQLYGKEYAFFEGSTEIARATPGGLDAFQLLTNAEQHKIRKQAILNIQSSCLSDGKVGVVAGHYMLWSEEAKKPICVFTDDDLNIFTHIVYLDVDAQTISTRLEHDTAKKRPSLETSQILAWQDLEKDDLRKTCYKRHILFISLETESVTVETLAFLLREFKAHTEAGNLSRVEKRVHQIMKSRSGPIKTILVLDADRTLSASDTGALFWQGPSAESPLKAIFSSHSGYLYTCFRQVSLLHQERFSTTTFNEQCEVVASKVILYPEIGGLLRRALAHDSDSGAIVVTCGLQLVCEKILALHGFPGFLSWAPAELMTWSSTEPSRLALSISCASNTTSASRHLETALSISRC